MFDIKYYIGHWELYACWIIRFSCTVRITNKNIGSLFNWMLNVGGCIERFWFCVRINFVKSYVRVRVDSCFSLLMSFVSL